MNNLTGKRFGRLTALEDSGERKSCHIVWRCMCDCGKITPVIGTDLKSGHTKSCGCLRIDALKKITYKHGGGSSKSINRLYRIWINMKGRCYNSVNKAYKYYGERGIKVCDEWRNNYSLFRFWALLNGYQENLTIDRIDNDGNYKPSNCQFITQSENTKKRKKLIH